MRETTTAMERLWDLVINWDPESCLLEPSPEESTLLVSDIQELLSRVDVQQAIISSLLSVP